jgi:signal peptidase I
MTFAQSTKEAQDLKQQSLKKSKKKKSFKRSLVEWFVVIIIAFVGALLIRTFVFQTYYIPSSSMEPTLDVGDRILVDKLAFDLGSIQRGDIVVFYKPPSVKQFPNGTVFVKRVIGLPGETIYSNKYGTIFINGKPIADPWLKDSPSGPGIQIRYQKIPKGYYFVMGDNRGDSEDSRYFGPIARSSIIGKVDMVFWRHGHPEIDIL